MKLILMIIFLALGIVYYTDFLFLFTKKDNKYWKSLLISAICSGLAIGISIL
jgi:hypothetical protein